MMVLKPVQRRILHAMKEMDDGRFLVANIMDEPCSTTRMVMLPLVTRWSIWDKDLLIGARNWEIYEQGDSAAAPRYIGEADQVCAGCGF